MCLFFVYLCDFVCFWLCFCLFVFVFFFIMVISLLIINEQTLTFCSQSHFSFRIFVVATLYFYAFKISECVHITFNSCKMLNSGTELWLYGQYFFFFFFFWCVCRGCTCSVQKYRSFSNFTFFSVFQLFQLFLYIGTLILCHME